jgi:selenide,water dikinase
MPAGDTTLQRRMLTDPQTSGGLLVACAADAAPAVLDIFRAQGFADAAVIGRLAAGAPAVNIT